MLGSSDEIISGLRKINQMGRNVRMINVYKGFPVAYDARILSIGIDAVTFKVHRYQALCLWLENQTFIQSAEFPEIVRAMAVTVDLESEIAALSNFEYVSGAPGKREDARVLLRSAIDVYLTIRNRKLRTELRDLSTKGMAVFINAAYYDPALLQVNEPLQITFQLPRRCMARRPSAPWMNFPISGLRPWRAFIWSMATIKRAAAEVHRDLGLLDAEKAGAIVQAPKKWSKAVGRPVRGRPFQAGAGTSHNMNTNEVIANRATQILGGSQGKTGQPQRPCQHGAIDQRHHPHRHPPGSACGGWMSCCRRGPAGAPWKKRMNSMILSNRAAPTCKMPCRCAWGRNLARMPAPWSAMRAHPPLCRRAAPPGNWRHRHRHGPERPPRIPRPHGEAIIGELTGLVLYESDDLFESMQSMADAADFSASCAPWRSP
jgi:hypothetical protein